MYNNLLNFIETKETQRTHFSFLDKNEFLSANLMFLFRYFFCFNKSFFRYFLSLFVAEINNKYIALNKNYSCSSLKLLFFSDKYSLDFS